MPNVSELARLEAESPSGDYLDLTTGKYWHREPGGTWTWSYAAPHGDSVKPNRQSRSEQLNDQFRSEQLNDHFFGRDNFAARRTTGHNLYDPESLITGAEVEAGLTYYDKREVRGLSRVPADLQIPVYATLCNGTFSPEEIAKHFPRVQ